MIKRILTVLLFLPWLLQAQDPLLRLKFNTEGIYKWRIYYSRGDVTDTLNRNAPVFAVEGDDVKLKSLGVDTLLNAMFRELRHARIKKRTWTAGGVRYLGRPEHISIWWKNQPEDKYHPDLNYYRIEVILNESPSVKEKKFGYVIVSVGPLGNDQTLHYVERSKAQAVVAAMRFMANADWGNNYAPKP